MKKQGIKTKKDMGVTEGGQGSFFDRMKKRNHRFKWNLVLSFIFLLSLHNGIRANGTGWIDVVMFLECLLLGSVALALLITINTQDK